MPTTGARGAIVIVAVVGLAVALSAFVLAPQVPAADPALLDNTVAEVKDRWPTIAHITAADLDRLKAKDQLVLFDVRTREEYAVSHIDGAIRVEPSMPAGEFAAAHGAALNGRTAVFYCSVGVRSSKFAERVKDMAGQIGAAGVANLEGGIFGWHRDRRPLADGKGGTPLVHPFDRSWGKAVARPGDISTEQRK